MCVERLRSPKASSFAAVTVSISKYIFLACGSYFLVDEYVIITVLVLVREILLDLSQTASLFEELSVNSKLLSFGDFSLPYEGKQLSSFFELFSQLLEFLCALGISASGLTDLPDFSSPKADVRIPIVCFCSCFELLDASVEVPCELHDATFLTFKFGMSVLFPDLNLRAFQCSYISRANLLASSSKFSSRADSISSHSRTGGLPTDAYGWFA